MLRSLHINSKAAVVLAPLVAYKGRLHGLYIEGPWSYMIHGAILGLYWGYIGIMEKKMEISI